MASIHLQLSAVVFMLSTLLTFGEYWLFDLCRQSGQRNEFQFRLIYGMTEESVLLPHPRDAGQRTQAVGPAS